MYYLKQYDNTLASFEMKNDDNGFDISSLSFVEGKEYLLPLDLRKDESGIKQWIRRRLIPKSRQFSDKILSKLGLDHNNTKGIIDACKGLSLNDCYWICEESYSKTWPEANLYDNPISRLLGIIAFTRVGSKLRSSLISSPELTTNGMLAKCWRRINGKIYLYKSGTSRFANAGLEPYSEYYASLIADDMGIHHVPYTLQRWKKQLCSVCPLFTSQDIAYLPIGYIIQEGGIAKAKEYLASLGEQYLNGFKDMIVFDALICNTDRHYGNFGLLIDNHSNKPIGFAPLFDHGASLFAYGMDDDEFKDIDSLLEYSKTRTPAIYADFIQMARQEMTPKQRNMLIKLKGFHFEGKTKYRLNQRRLKLIEEFIQLRIAEILKDYN